MNRSKAYPLALALLLLVFAAACGTGSADEPPAEVESTKAEPVTEAATETEYEPAYPEDVSAEGLSEEDASQQHSHGDGEHSHADGEDAGDHGHTDSEDEHSHGGDNHSH